LGGREFGAFFVFQYFMPFFTKAICKMGSKFVTLGSKVFFLGGNIFIFLSSKITFLAAKVGSRNYFSGQQELFFRAARIHILSSKYFSYRNSKFWFI
jgi:hypothetical protein